MDTMFVRNFINELIYSFIYETIFKQTKNERMYKSIKLKNLKRKKKPKLAYKNNAWA